MALKFSLLISSLIFINACKFNDKPTWHYTPETDKAKEQLFDITIGKANVLVCKGGTKIHISANSFIGSPSSFKLKVKEALTVSDMLAFGLSTNAENNVLLESSGMIQISLVEDINVTINSSAPLKIEMPARYLSENVRLYTEGVAGNGSFLWKESGKLNNDTTLKKIELGKQLFYTNCSNCHSKKLDDILIGPPLAHVQKRRSIKWLFDFTRNSQEMISKARSAQDNDTFKDRYSLCNWQTYSSLMTAFPNLSDNELTAIYDFIQNESEKQNYKFDENYCFGEKSLTFIRNQEIEDTNVTTTITSPFTSEEANIMYNNLTISNFEWHNCDSPIENCEDIELAFDNIGEPVEETDIYFIFKKRKILYHWYSFPIVNIPQEEAKIIAFGKTKNGVVFCEKTVKFEKKNKHKLQFKSYSNEKLKEIIEKL